MLSRQQSSDDEGGPETLLVALNMTLFDTKRRRG
jgi:hypothetical protein